jgi:hypothetical protein
MLGRERFMRHVLAVMAIAACQLTRSVVEGAPAVSPVPPELLDGRKLSVARDNFVIDAPEGSWQWMQAQLSADAGSLYYCQREGGGRFMVLVVPDMSLEEGNGWFLKALADSKASQERKGRRISNLTQGESEIPMPGSYRWHADVDIPGMGIMGWRGFATRADRIYQFQYYGSDPELAAAFETWVGSFRRLRAPGRGMRGFVETTGLLFASVALILGAVLGMVVNAVLGRRRVNPGTAAACCIIAVVIGEGVFLLARGMLPTDPGGSGRVIGILVGSAILPLLCAVGISFVFRKNAQQGAQRP